MFPTMIFQGQPFFTGLPFSDLRNVMSANTRGEARGRGGGLLVVLLRQIRLDDRLLRRGLRARSVAFAGRRRAAVAGWPTSHTLSYRLEGPFSATRQILAREIVFRAIAQYPSNGQWRPLTRSDILFILVCGMQGLRLGSPPLQALSHCCACCSVHRSSRSSSRARGQKWEGAAVTLDGKEEGGRGKVDRSREASLSEHASLLGGLSGDRVDCRGGRGQSWSEGGARGLLLQCGGSALPQEPGSDLNTAREQMLAKRSRSVREQTTQALHTCVYEQSVAPSKHRL